MLICFAKMGHFAKNLCMQRNVCVPCSRLPHGHLKLMNCLKFWHKNKQNPDIIWNSAILSPYLRGFEPRAYCLGEAPQASSHDVPMSIKSLFFNDFQHSKVLPSEWKKVWKTGFIQRSFSPFFAETLKIGHRSESRGLSTRFNTCHWCAVWYAYYISYSKITQSFVTK